MDNHTIDITDAVTPSNPDTRKKIEKGLAALAIASSAILLVNHGLKKFAERKRVVLTVVDNQPSD